MKNTLEKSKENAQQALIDCLLHIKSEACKRSVNPSDILLYAKAMKKTAEAIEAIAASVLPTQRRQRNNYVSTLEAENYINHPSTL